MRNGPHMGHRARPAPYPSPLMVTSMGDPDHEARTKLGSEDTGGEGEGRMEASGCKSQIPRMKEGTKPEGMW